jgi:hypothetical protein
MNRFLKGTIDHDSDGRMGGSLKGDGTMADKPETKAAVELLDKGVTKVEPAKATAHKAPVKHKAKPKAPEKADEPASAEDPAEVALRQAALGGL